MSFSSSFPRLKFFSKSMKIISRKVLKVQHFSSFKRSFHSFQSIKVYSAFSFHCILNKEPIQTFQKLKFSNLKENSYDKKSLVNWSKEELKDFLSKFELLKPQNREFSGYGLNLLSPREVEQNFPTTGEFFSQIIQSIQLNTKESLSQGLLLAANRNNKFLVEFFLKRGAFVNYVHPELKFSILYDAASNNLVDIMKILLEHKADVNLGNITSNASPLYIASMKGHLEAVKLLLQWKAEIDRTCKNTGITALFAATFQNRQEIVKLLIENKANIWTKSLQGFNCMHIACATGCIELVQYFFQLSPNWVDVLTEQNETCLILAASEGRIELVKFLLKHTTKINHFSKTGFDALLAACFNGHFHVAEELLKSGKFDIHFIHPEVGFSYLSTACLRSNKPAIQFFLKHGANINQLDINLTTPLFHAIKNRNIELVKFLLQQKDINLEQVIHDSGTVLHFGTTIGNLEIVKLLIAHGADRYKLTSNSETLLHLACRNGNLKLIEYCLTLGIDVSAKNNLGQTAIDIAKKSNKKDLISLFSKY